MNWTKAQSLIDTHQLPFEIQRWDDKSMTLVSTITGMVIANEPGDAVRSLRMRVGLNEAGRMMFQRQLRESLRQEA